MVRVPVPVVVVLCVVGCDSGGSSTPPPAQRIPCAETADCADGWVCDAGECAQLCNASAECPTEVERCDDGICRIAPNNECDRDADCDRPGTCEVSLRAVCVGGICSYPLAMEGTPCDDGNACTTPDTCSANGVCEGPLKVCDSPPPPECDAANETFTQFLPRECAVGNFPPCPNQCDPMTGDCLYQRVDLPCLDCLESCLQVCQNTVCTNIECMTDGPCVPENPPRCDISDRPDGFPCDFVATGDGVCVSGACEECAVDLDCDDGNECTLDQCTANNTCAYFDAPDTTICSDTTPNDCWEARCDNAGSCSQEGVIRPATDVCRMAQGLCDIADTCDGVTGDCPADVKVGSGVECRGVAGDCDVAEQCDGTSAACPDDTFLSTAVECRPEDMGADGCDTPEVCPGDSPDCPQDLSEPDGTSCTDPETNDCESYSCQDGACVAGVAAAGFACGPAAGPCDVPEVCNGSDLTCPADAKRPMGFMCEGVRLENFGCASPGVCDGVGDMCPGLIFSGNGTPCQGLGFVGSGFMPYAGECVSGRCAVPCGSPTTCESMFAGSGCVAGAACSSGYCQFYCDSGCVSCDFGAQLTPCSPPTCCEPEACF